MASEASVADQTVNEPIQVTREVNGLKNDEVVIPETKDVNGKVDEIRVEDTTVFETAGPVQELKQQESEIHIPQDTKEVEVTDDKSAFELSVESTQTDVKSENNLSISQESDSQVVKVTKEEEEGADESVQQEAENETNSPDGQQSVSDQAEEVTKEEAKDNEAAAEPVESGEKEVQDPVNLPDIQDNVSQSVEVTKEVANDSKSDLEPAFESVDRELDVETVSPPIKDADTQSVEAKEEEAKGNDSALEPSNESAGTEVENASRLSGTQQSDTPVAKEIKEEVADKNQSVESAQEELDNETKISGTPEPSNEAQDKPTEVVEDIAQESETEIRKESVTEVVSEVQSDLPEAPAELASESVAEDKVVSEVQSDLSEAPAELTSESLSVAEDKVISEVQSDLPKAPAELASESVVEDKVVSEVQSDLPEAPAELASESVAEDKVVEPPTDPIPEPTDDVGTVDDTSETTDLPQVEKTVDHEVQVKLETLEEVPSNGTSVLATEEQTTISQSSVVENPNEVISEPKDVVEAVASDILTPKKHDDSHVSSDTNGTSELATEEHTAKSESLVVENPTELINEPKDVVETVASEILTSKKDDDSNVSSHTNGTSELVTEEKTAISESVAVENPTEVISEPKDIVEAVISDVHNYKKDDSNVSSDTNGTSELATEEQSAKSESSVVENPTEVISDPKDVLQAVASDILTAKKDDDSNVSSDTKDYENGTVDVISSAATTATENLAILESVAESRKEDQENPVEATITTEVENPTVSETTDTMKENGIAEDGKETMDSAAPEVTIEEKGEALESTYRDIGVDGIANKVSETIAETTEVGAEPKKTESKHTLLEKFASETSEDKKEEAGDVEDRSLPETTTDGNDTKADGEPPKQEIPVKTSQRQSSNIISKVKKSIGKVKKAITGKSPSSKTSTSENKDTTKA